MKETDRRSFVELSIYGLGAIIAAALGIPAIAYLFSRKADAGATSWVDVGKVDEIPSTEPREVLFRRKRIDGWKKLDERTSAWLVKGEKGEVVALAPGCTHLGCAYHWSAKNHEFVCPCHASTFGVDGTVTSGPAPRPLDRYVTRIVAGKLQLGDVRRSDA